MRYIAGIILFSVVMWASAYIATLRATIDNYKIANVPLENVRLIKELELRIEKHENTILSNLQAIDETRNVIIKQHESNLFKISN